MNTPVLRTVEIKAFVPARDMAVSLQFYRDLGFETPWMSDELAYLERVAELFGMSPLTFRRLKATHLGWERDDPYLVLGVDHDASDEEVRAVWRKALTEAHPDRARSRGLPSEFVEVAEAKAAAINAAYDAIVRERKALALKGAA